MYRKDSEGWLKHGDFIVLDMICLQLAFIFAYAFRGYGFNVYGDILYRNMAIFLGFADLVVIFTSGTMKSVLKRGHYKEFVSTLKNAVAVGALAIAYLFIIQEGQSFSRMILITTIVIYLILTYAIREIWKNSLHKKMENGGDKKLLIITSKAVAENVVHSMQENNYARYSLAGVVVIDEDCTGEKICASLLLPAKVTCLCHVCQEWIDEVLIVISENLHIRRAYRQAHRNRCNRSSEPCKNHQPDWQKTVCGKGWKLHSSDHQSELCILRTAFPEAPDGHLRRTGWLYFHRNHYYFRWPRPSIWHPQVRFSSPRNVWERTERNSKCTNSAACTWMRKRGKPSL